MNQLTNKEKEIYEYLTEAIRRDGYSPSVRDIQNALGIKSTSTVHAYLSRLEKKGYIQKEQGKSRTLRVESLSSEPQKTVKIPILGRVAAGSPILAVENHEGYIDFPTMNRAQAYGEMFGLRIQGESMIDAGIMNGDIVVVKKENYAQNGDIVVALVDDEATVKRFYKENGRFRLQPENKTMQPIYVNEVYILGKVIAVIRYYK